MLKHSFIISFVILSSYASIFAQVDNLEITWSEEIPAKKKLITDIFSLGRSNEFFAINQSFRISNREAVLQKYTNLEQITEVQLTQDYKRGKSVYQDIIELNNSLFMLTYGRDRIAKSLTVQGIDAGTLRPSGSEEIIYNVKLEKGARSSIGEYSRSVSPNETKLAYVIEFPGDRKQEAKSTVKLFNDNFELLWKKNIVLKSTRELSQIYSISVGDDGLVYILSRVWDERRERERNERNYEFYLTVVTENGEETTRKLALEDYFINELKLNINTEGKLVCGGFYSNMRGVSEGVFYLSLNPETFEIEKLSLKKFDLDFITDGLSNRAKQKTQKRSKRGKDVGLAHVDFRDIIMREDGGAVLVGEYVNIFTTTVTNADGSTSSTTHYHYDDIYVINIDPSGEIEWAKKISKIQHSSNDGGFYSSFFLFVGEQELNFFFNIRENRENILHAVSIDGTGNQVSKDIVNNNRKEKIKIRPKSCEQISDSDFILFALSRKHNKFARVTVR